MRLLARHCYLILLFQTNANDVDDAPAASHVSSRYDVDAYFSARRIVDADEFSNDDFSSPRKPRRRKRNDGLAHDDPARCTLHVAPSSIPHSGLGMYASLPCHRGETFPFPEVGILFQDKDLHVARRRTPPSTLLSHYPWSARVLSHGDAEVAEGEAFVPGLGMLANSGLVNARLKHAGNVSPPWDATDFPSVEGTAEDAGRGASSPHGRVRFEAERDVRAGEELFVSYGDEWFAARESTLGIVPGGNHFREADERLRRFWGGGGEDADDRGEEYETLLGEAEREDPRLRRAFPDKVEDVPLALSVGTARFSAPNSIRTEEWLRENGACIDNIVGGTSTIPQAGRGAFATRFIKKGDRIAATPVLTLEREMLLLWEERKTAKGDDDEGGPETDWDVVGHQLLLNYCYGHADSSLLFFPYASTVNFINHGAAGDVNAEIRWSTLPSHRSEWLLSSLQEMKERTSTGLMFDIVAIKDIRRGEEVLLYYGKEWEESWNRHLREWSSNVAGGRTNITESLNLPTNADFNQQEDLFVRTEEEQRDNPYPSYIMTRCLFEETQECTSANAFSDDSGSYHGRSATQLTAKCQSRWTLTFNVSHLRPCTILSRQTIEGMDWYTAQVEVASKDKNANNEITYYLVTYMPRYAIRFVDKPYTRDQYAKGVFRHFIGLGDEIMPDHWMDLGAEEGC